MKNNVQATIHPLNVQKFHVTIRGTNNVIYHKWDPNQIQMIENKQTQKAEANRREAKNPEELGEATFYKDAKGDICLYALWIKSAMIGAARSLENIHMTELRQWIKVQGDTDPDLIPVTYEEKSIRRDMVRIGKGQSDIRYRGQIRNWSAVIPITFNAGKISAEQVVNLLQVAGFSCGIGDWRPELGGDFGTFEVVV